MHFPIIFENLSETHRLIKRVNDSVPSERIKARVAHFPTWHYERTVMQRTTLGKCSSACGTFVVIRTDSESIFQQQFGEHHGNN